VISCVLDFSREHQQFFGSRIIAGLAFLVKSDSKAIVLGEAWSDLLKILTFYCRIPNLANAAFECLMSLIAVSSSPLNYQVSFSYLLNLLKDETVHCSSDRILDAMVQLYSRLRNIMSRMRKYESPSKDKNLIKELWFIALDSFSEALKDPRIDVRIHVVDCLQRALLSSGVIIKNAKLIKLAFEKYLFPILSIFEDESCLRSLKDFSPVDIKIKVSNLMFQTFIVNVRWLCLLRDFEDFWLTFLGLLDNFMNLTEPNEQLSFHFKESLRNCLVTMILDSVFDEVHHRTGTDLLSLTLSIIESVRPTFKDDLLSTVKEVEVMPRNVLSPDSLQSSRTASPARSSSSMRL